jgi:stage III sporulation protein AH
MSKKKKIIVLSSMIALLAVTAALNFIFAGANSYPESTETAYFLEYRTERTTARNEQILQLDKIINESEEDSSAKESALMQKMQLLSLTEQELRLESVIKAYGYDEVVVTMSLNSPNVSVVVKEETFEQADAIKIYNLLAQESNIDCENVNIIPYL